MSLIDALRRPWPEQLDRAEAGRFVPYLAIAVAGVIAFFPGLGARFVSDDFNFIDWTRFASLRDVLAQFSPTTPSVELGGFYRPFDVLVIWVEFHAFGLHPAAYHLVALACHLAIAILLFRLATRLGVGVWAALAGVAGFVLSIHAHEVMYNWAGDHYVFGGVAIVAAVLAYVEGWTIPSLVFTVLALLTDEAGVALLPTLVVCEALFGRPAPSLIRRALGLVPTALAVAGYLVLRLSSGGFSSEGQTCRTVGCQTLGLIEYFDQLFVRPGRLIELLRAYPHTPSPIPVAAATVAALAGAAVLLRVWHWRDWRVIAFGGAWCVIWTGLFVYALWPYVSDRFFYYPEMGLALAIAGGAQQALRSWRSASEPGRAAAAGVLAAYLAWTALGVSMIWQRAAQWNAAGSMDASYFDQTVRLEPNPPSGAVFVFQNVPDTLIPDIAPGNTGPYLLRNGLKTGLRLRYDRYDIDAVAFPKPVPPGATTLICLGIDGATVTRVDCPR